MLIHANESLNMNRDVTICCTAVMDTTEQRGKSHDHQHAKRAHRLNRRALGIKDKMLACASTRGVCRDNNMKGQLCRMNDRSDINYSQRRAFGWLVRIVAGS